jgi:NAD(P)-dependent dehydrogenase (short-subunit alcohol dehydrogenase family)
MRERGFGRVVAIGSVQESRPRDDCLVYAAGKAAQTQMMLNWARHAAAPGVTFNVRARGRSKPSATVRCSPTRPTARRCWRACRWGASARLRTAWERRCCFARPIAAI